MNKRDIFLVVFLLCVSFFFIFFKKTSSYAFVYYENVVVKKIDLSINDSYVVEGYNGEVVIEVLNNKLRVVKETSPNNLCSKQGFESSRSIICLPNKILIKFEDDDIDSILR